MSGSDIRDILQIGKPSSDATHSRRLNKQPEKRPGIMSFPPLPFFFFLVILK